MKLYVDPMTVNCRKVLAGFELLDVDFERVDVGSFQLEQELPDFTRINPHASLPALVNDGLILWESNTILQYAADLVHSEAYYPHDERIRAAIHQWMLWESSAWFPSCHVYLVEHCVKPLLGQKSDRPLLEQQTENFHRLAACLDRHLAESPWVAGDRLTIADIALAAPLHLHPYPRIPIDQHPHLHRWMSEQMEGLPWSHDLSYESNVSGRERAVPHDGFL